MKEIMLEMMDKGYRVYVIDGVSVLERNLERLAKFHLIEVITFSPSKLVFVKDAKANL